MTFYLMKAIWGHSTQKLGIRDACRLDLRSYSEFAGHVQLWSQANNPSIPWWSYTLEILSITDLALLGLIFLAGNITALGRIQDSWYRLFGKAYAVQSMPYNKCCLSCFQLNFQWDLESWKVCQRILLINSNYHILCIGIGTVKSRTLQCIKLWRYPIKRSTLYDLQGLHCFVFGL